MSKNDSINDKTKKAKFLNFFKNNQRKIELKPNWFDLIILGCSLAIAGSLMAYVAISTKKANSVSGDKIATVYYMNNKVEEVNLSELTEVYVFTMEKKDYSNLVGELQITFDPDKGCAVTETECPDKICQNQGYINIAGQPIVCLPNNVYVIITIENSKNNGGFLE